METILETPDWIVPVIAVVVLFIVLLAKPILGIISMTVEVMWIKRGKKFGETDEQWLRREWDKKSDESILLAYEDAKGWIEISQGMMRSETTIDIADDCIRRWETYVKPQMVKRSLPFELRYKVITDEKVI